MGQRFEIHCTHLETLDQFGLEYLNKFPLRDPNFLLWIQMKMEDGWAVTIDILEDDRTGEDTSYFAGTWAREKSNDKKEIEEAGQADNDQEGT